MAKDKKKHSKKDKVSDGILDAAALSLKKFRKVTKQISKLSTGQKLVGGAALLAAGLTYLARNQSDDNPASPDDAHPPKLLGAGHEHSPDEEATAGASHKGRKAPKAK
ncbi:hypothetical protein [Hymenobacter terricola]|uniref:hypothetical protein n=1 Tax=Hymenobacter terricola TaxID=2819236 RepID=UPI001B3028CF|nr:hypothetical protein [Hymenobacter terricola]